MATPHRLLFATDFSRCSEQAFEHALWWTERLSAELLVVHCLASEIDAYDLDTLPVVDLAAQREVARGRALEGLEALAQKAAARGLRASVEVLEGGPVAVALCDLAAARKVDLVILGTHGRRGLGRFFLGSVAEKVVRTSTRPVFTVREAEAAPVPGVAAVIAPVDFSEGARQGAKAALALALRFGVPLHLVHVIDPALEAGLFMPGAFPVLVSNTGELKAAAELSLGRLRDELVAGLPAAPVVELAVLYGSPPYELTDLARGIPSAWIVMATQSHHGLERLLLGSTAERVLRLTSGPVITLGRGATEVASDLFAP